ncbi:hypothetical protein ILYODFUR_015126, partial [Ilyodon furcidens]
FFPSPRWRTLCCGCCPGMSVYAAACRDALLNSSSGSRDINRSRGGPGAAIVFQRITHQSTTNTIYSKQQANKTSSLHDGTSTMFPCGDALQSTDVPPLSST